MATGELRVHDSRLTLLLLLLPWPWPWPQVARERKECWRLYAELQEEKLATDRADPENTAKRREKLDQRRGKAMKQFQKFEALREKALDAIDNVLMHCCSCNTRMTC